MIMSHFFKADRAGVTGLIGVSIGFINLIFYANKNLYLLAAMLLLVPLTAFFVFKDRNKEAATRYKVFLISLLTVAVSLIIYAFFKYQ